MSVKCTIQQLLGKQAQKLSRVRRCDRISRVNNIELNNQSHYIVIYGHCIAMRQFNSVTACLQFYRLALSSMN